MSVIGGHVFWSFELLLINDMAPKGQALTVVKLGEFDLEFIITEDPPKLEYFLTLVQKHFPATTQATLVASPYYSLAEDGLDMRVFAHDVGSKRWDLRLLTPEDRIKRLTVACSRIRGQYETSIVPDDVAALHNLYVGRIEKLLRLRKKTKREAKLKDL